MVAWATKALDDVRREIWQAAKKAGAPALTAGIKGCRHALLNNPDHLTNNQQAGLARLAQVNKTLYRAYLLNEQFRLLSQPRAKAAVRASTTGAPRPDDVASPPSSTSTPGSSNTRTPSPPP